MECAAPESDQRFARAALVSAWNRRLPHAFLQVTASRHRRDDLADQNQVKVRTDKGPPQPTRSVDKWPIQEPFRTSRTVYLVDFRGCV